MLEKASGLKETVRAWRPRENYRKINITGSWRKGGLCLATLSLEVIWQMREMLSELDDLARSLPDRILKVPPAFLVANGKM